MTVTVSTAAYELAYGRKPRGFGLWCFEAAGQWFEHTGSYSEANAAAVRWAHETGASVVELRCTPPTRDPSPLKG